MKGGIGWKLITLALDCDPIKVISDVPVSRNWFTTDLYEN